VIAGAELDVGSILQNALQIALGVFVGGVLNWWFARQSSRELQAETTKLRHMVTILARYLDEAQVIKAEFNADDELVGWRKPAMTGALQPHGSLMVEAIRAPDSAHDGLLLRDAGLRRPRRCTRPGRW
jgi:hypothetical protein